MPPKVTALVLNFNNAADTRESLLSLKRSDYPDLQIILIDNASEDKRWRDLPGDFPGVRVLENKSNLGYAGGNNAGIREALESGCEYVFILNNDAVVCEDTIRLLVEYAETDPLATICAPKICNYTDRSRIDSLGTSMDWFRLRPRPGSWGLKDDMRLAILERDVLPGSALLLRCRDLREESLFDENFFLIHEDADLCLRNLKAGFKNKLVAKAVVYHKVSATLSKYPHLSTYYSTRNFLYLAKQRASILQRIFTVIGLFFLLFKNSFGFLFLNDSEKKKNIGFFQGVADYFRNRMGPKAGVL